MARARMIACSLSTSQSYYALFEIAGPLAEFCQSLYPLVVVHCDDHGRMSGDAFTVKMRCHPSSPRSLREFDDALGAMDRAGLIRRAEVNGGIYLQVVGFDDIQSGLHKRKASKFPEIPGDSRKIPVELNRTELELELKGTEGKGTELNAPSDAQELRARETETEPLDCDPITAKLVAEGVVSRANAETGLYTRAENNARAAAGVPLPAPAPINRPARTGISAPDVRHRGCYGSGVLPSCARGVCVPAFLGNQWLDQLRDEPYPTEFVARFVSEVMHKTPSGPIGDDPLKFWRAQWAAKHGTAAPSLVTTKADRTMAAARRVAAKMAAGAVVS